MNFHEICATYGLACMLYLVARLLFALANHLADNNAPKWITSLLAVIVFLFGLCSIPAVATFGLFEFLNSPNNK